MESIIKIQKQSSTLILFVLLVFFMLIFSCSNQNVPVKDKNGNLLTTNTLIAKVRIDSDTNLSYALYIPKQYSESTKIPVLFFFDPHGDGTLPLKNYQLLADTYGYLFIGSNNIKNGQSGTYNIQVFQALLQEVRTKYPVDDKNIFTAGFSGGAKIAQLLAQQFTEVSGVIVCGGSLPFTAIPTERFYFSGIVGSTDFNYLEMQQAFSAYDQAGIDYTSVVFKGGHQWPPVEVFNKAITGLEIFRTKTQRLARNSEWLNEVWETENDSIQLYIKRNDIIAHLQELRQTERWFNGLRNIIEIKKQEIAVEQSPAFYEQIKKTQNYIQKEVMLRTEFIKAIDQRDLEWWNQEIGRIEKTKQASDEQMVLVTQRLLNYISMASFMLIKTDLDDVNLDDAFKKIQIYEKVDPRNPDVYLMYARYYLLLGNRDLMVSNFKKAVDSGFNSWGTYENENSWKSLFEQPEILKFNQH